MDAPHSSEMVALPDQIASPSDHRPASQAFFDTVELLEHMLVQLNFKTLLFAQRVDRRFHGVIQNSSALQKKLFFAPVKSLKEAEELGMIGPDTIQVCSLSHDEFSIFRMSAHGGKLAAIVNRALVLGIDQVRMYQNPVGVVFASRCAFDLEVNSGLPMIESWKKMYLCPWKDDALVNELRDEMCLPAKDTMEGKEWAVMAHMINKLRRCAPDVDRKNIGLMRLAPTAKGVCVRTNEWVSRRAVRGLKAQRAD